MLSEVVKKGQNPRSPEFFNNVEKGINPHQPHKGEKNEKRIVIIKRIRNLD